MGREKRKKYHKNMNQQLYMKLQGMLAIGESKRAAQKDGTAKDKIFSAATYKTYKKHLRYFTAWLKTAHPECKTLKKAKRYANEWLAYRAEECKTQQGKPLSAWTIQTEAAAINKLYGISKDDPDRYQPPERHRADITRSRGEVKRDSHFSERNNWELVCFARGTGARVTALKRLEGRDLWTKAQMATAVKNLSQKAREGSLNKDQQRELRALNDALNFYQRYPEYDMYVCFRKDKGGRTRFSPVIGPHKAEIVQRFRSTPAGEKVWQAIPAAMDCHSYRSDYAVAIYKEHARPLDQCGRGEIYYCRGDECGVRYDKTAMQVTSKALGHNRLDVIARHYLRGV